MYIVYICLLLVSDHKHSCVVELLAVVNTCAPTHIGDPPGDGVITFGIILPFRKQAPGDQCGDYLPEVLVRTEGLVWAMRNARTIHAPAGLGIGKIAFIVFISVQYMEYPNIVTHARY